MEKQFGTVKVKLVQGDITELDVDCIVNAANNHLWMGAGVAGAIKRKGGQEIEDEAVKKGPVEVGEAVVSGAGRLKAKHVIHGAVMGQDLKTDADKIKRTTENCLKRFIELGHKSIAFPALGTGVGGFSFSECARIMLSVVKDWAQKLPPDSTVIFALFGDEAYQAFERELKALRES